MKKLLFVLLFTTALKAGSLYTATSFSIGTNQFNNLSGGYDIKVEEFFIYSTLPKLYAKVGFYQEQLFQRLLADGTYTVPDTSNNLFIGAGYNLLTLGNFFIDAGAGLSILINVNSNPIDFNSGGYTQIANLYKINTLSPFAELGVGYAFAKWTVRTDLSITAPSEVALVEYTNDLTTAPLIQDFISFNRIHLNLAVAYWW